MSLPNEVMPLKTWQKMYVWFSLFAGAAYLVWRALFTINPEHPIYSWLFLVGDCVGYVTTLLFAISVYRLRERVSPPLKSKPTVDVFIPTYNEEPEILLTTIYHCVNMDYPHETYVLDDKRRPEIEKLALELGAHYITRKDNAHAKAGNLNNALSKTKGEIVAIFDADGVPRKDFLTKLLGYLDDKNIALVQVPQTFYNLDSFQHLSQESEQIIWHEQSLFFDIIQSGRDMREAAMCCGSGCLFRRSALEEVGGFAVETVTEDLHTTLKLHQKGHKTVYHPEHLAFCLAPSSVMQYIVQRGRWAFGNVQLLRLEWKNLVGPGSLNFFQRAAYLTAIYYFTSIQRFFYYFAPALFLVFGIAPIAGPEWILLPVVAYLMIGVGNYYILARGRGRYFQSEMFFLYTVWVFVKGLIAGLIPWTKSNFKVTSKAPSSEVPTSMLAPAALVMLVSVCGECFAIRDMQYRPGDSGMILALAFCFLYLGIAGIAILMTKRKPFSEEAYSFFDYRPLSISAIDGVPVSGHHAGVAVVISEKALRYISATPIQEKAEVQVSLCLATATLPLKGHVTACRIRFGEGAEEPTYEVDLKFSELVQTSRMELIRYFFEDATPRVLNAKTKLRRKKVTKAANQRQHMRLETLLPVFLNANRAEGASDFIAMLIDLSMTGARLRLPEEAKVGTQVQINIPWVKSSVRAKIVRCTKDNSAINATYDVGLIFEEAVPLTKKQLQSVKAITTDLPGNVPMAG